MPFLKYEFKEELVFIQIKTKKKNLVPYSFIY
jgi:hypothetical protein